MDKDTEKKEFGVSPIQGAIKWLVQYENYLKALSSVFGVPRELLSLPTKRAQDAASPCAHRFHAEDDNFLYCIDCPEKTPRQ